MPEPCAVCGTSAEGGLFGGVNKSYDCPRCGFWVVVPYYGEQAPLSLREALGDWDRKAIHRRSRLSHILRQQQSQGQTVAVPVGQLPQWRLDDPLPSPAEQLDRFLTWVGEHQPSPAERVVLPVPEVAAWIGATIRKDQPDRAVGWLIGTDECRQLIEAPNGNGATRLTLAGWRRFEELRQATSRSRIAFMALQFGDPEVEPFVTSLFRPAVERAGFELRVLTDNQPAGLIDDQLRVALRTARFVIADLTRGNKGAYWEAGFAEGLGRPVIYTCRRGEWDEATTRPHFDTNHLLTIVWDPENPGLAAAQPTATIRATLPEEAKLTDQ